MNVSEDVASRATDESKWAYTEGNNGSNSDGRLVCASCGKIVDKVYQNGACKPCLLQDFRRYISVIDDFQANIS